MAQVKWTVRTLRLRVTEILSSDDFKSAEIQLLDLPPKLLVNPLFSLFYDKKEILKWRAITAMGIVVSHLAEDEPEAGRVIMRRLMWNLNDESGGIGWGSPEAMAEIMVRSDRLAREYHQILISYIRPDGNFIEHEMLQRGVLWGIGRLSHAKPDLAVDAGYFLTPYLKSEDPIIRGFAAYALHPLAPHIHMAMPQYLLADPCEVPFYHEGLIIQTTVSKLANGLSDCGSASP